MKAIGYHCASCNAWTFTTPCARCGHGEHLDTIADGTAPPC